MGPVLLLFLLLTFDGGSRYAPVSDHVDVIELNHVVSEAGESSLDQIIFWDWSPSQSRYAVRAWRQYRTKSQLPTLQPSGQYRTTWRDVRDSNVMRAVTAPSVLETWTTYDAETSNQEFFERDRRRELAFPGKRGGK